ncbi:hypothetical protein ACFPU1_13060 [Thalassorhabdus alkalitolerans]|uniref:Uncharacterized protein n=1 Tax=Thalassorhabdus alkalitolerans TaxID=2282697 RepID=A0ABW0YTN4_9BACI|nr:MULTISPECIES: hypothetical protein [Bacillaceae]
MSIHRKHRDDRVDDQVQAVSTGRNKLDNENFIKDKNYNVAEAVIKNSGNSYVNVHVDAESFAKGRAKSFADADAKQAQETGFQDGRRKR